MTNTDKSKKADHAPAEKSADDDGSISGHIKAPLKQRIKQLEAERDELLAACKHLLAITHNTNTQQYKAAETAIAKAEGSAQ